MTCVPNSRTTARPRATYRSRPAVTASESVALAVLQPAERRRQHLDGANGDCRCKDDPVTSILPLHTRLVQFG